MLVTNGVDGRTAHPTKVSTLSPPTPPRIGRIALLGNASPRRCGIATFTDHVRDAIATRCPQARYRIVGATHPHLVDREGEAYRARLQALATDQGVAPGIDWDARFLDEGSLIDIIAAADVYVTPYTDASQITSGTLAYGYGLGKPVVSTPYVHAAELLGGEAGRLVPFGDPSALADAVSELMADEELRVAMAGRAYSAGRDMRWSMMVERALAAMAPAACATLAA